MTFIQITPENIHLLNSTVFSLAKERPLGLSTISSFWLSVLKIQTCMYGMVWDRKILTFCLNNCKKGQLQSSKCLPSLTEFTSLASAFLFRPFQILSPRIFKMMLLTSVFLIKLLQKARTPL
jgi:hypothetical protein